jgi:cytochrome c-type biogenesis protein
VIGVFDPYTVRPLGPYALALVAGVLSFTSLCCLPVIPGYVSYVSGVAGSGSGIMVRPRVVGLALLFVLGFATVFTLLGASASALGSVLLANRQTLIRVGGAFVILMGILTMGLLRIPPLYGEHRVDLGRIRSGPLGAVPLRIAFALGWTPCIGPVLAGILTAAATGSAFSGATLLFVYSLGLGVPFILLALGYAVPGESSDGSAVTAVRASCSAGPSWC